MARCPIRAKVEIRSVSGGLVYLCQLPADCFVKRRTPFIGDGRILLEPAWIRGGEDEEVLDWRRVTVVLFFSRG